MAKITLFQMRNRAKAKSRSLLCFWAIRELGMLLTDMVKHLGISVSGVEYAVEMGEAIKRDKSCHLVDRLS